MIPESFKHNKFVRASIPSPADLFLRDGTFVTPAQGRYSGDVEVPALNPRKTDISLEAEDYAVSTDES